MFEAALSAPRALIKLNPPLCTCLGPWASCAPPQDTADLGRIGPCCLLVYSTTILAAHACPALCSSAACSATVSCAGVGKSQNWLMNWPTRRTGSVQGDQCAGGSSVQGEAVCRGGQCSLWPVCLGSRVDGHPHDGAAAMNSVFAAHALSFMPITPMHYPPSAIMIWAVINAHADSVLPIHSSLPSAYLGYGNTTVGLSLYRPLPSGTKDAPLNEVCQASRLWQGVTGSKAI